MRLSAWLSGQDMTIEFALNATTAETVWLAEIEIGTEEV